MKWSRGDSLAVLALALAPFVQSARLFIPASHDRVFFPDGDFIDQFYAIANLKTALLAAGHWPLWNPFSYAGSPLWADIQAAVAYPLGLLVVLASAFLWGRLPLVALEFEAISHLSLAGVFTYLFARRVLDSRPGAALAALSFGLGGYLTGYPPLQLAILETDVWLPLALLGVLWTVGQRRRRPHPLWPSAWALGILAGHPQSALLFSVATVAYFGWQVAVSDAAAPQTADAASQPVGGQPGPPQAAGGEPLGGQPGPSQAVGQHHLGGQRLAGSASASGRLTARLAKATATGRQALLQQPASQLAIAVGLALGASAAGWLPAWPYWRLSNRAASDYAALAHGFAPRELLGLVLPTISYWAPLYGGLIPLVLAIAAGWRAWARTNAAARHDRFWVALGLGALLLSLGGHSIVFPLLYRFVPGFAFFRGQERAAFLVSFSLAILAGRGLVVLLDRVPRMGGRRRLSPAARPLALLAVFALTGVDLFLNNGLHGWVAQPPHELANSPLIASLVVSDHTRTANEDRLPANFGVLHGIESTSGASPLRLRRFDRLYGTLSGDLEVRRWDLLAVERVLTTRPTLAESSRAEPSVDGHGVRQFLHRLREPNPRAWWVPEARVAADEADALALVASPAIDLRQAVILEAPVADRGTVAAREPRPTGSARVVEREAGFMRIQCVASARGWLVISEMFHPGWQARLDGQPVRTYGANVALMAVAMPAGEHSVELRFTDPWAAAGAALTVLFGLVLAAALVTQRP